MALITGQLQVKALKANDSLFGSPGPPQIHVHVYRAHTLHPVL